LQGLLAKLMPRLKAVTVEKKRQNLLEGLATTGFNKFFAIRRMKTADYADGTDFPLRNLRNLWFIFRTAKNI
jgi:hypothetical protein